MITEPDKPHKGYPVLEAKAAEVKHFLPCLQRILADVVDDDDDDEYDGPAQVPNYAVRMLCVPKENI